METDDHTIASRGAPPASAAPSPTAAVLNKHAKEASDAIVKLVEGIDVTDAYKLPCSNATMASMENRFMALALLLPTAVATALALSLTNVHCGTAYAYAAPSTGRVNSITSLTHSVLGTRSSTAAWRHHLGPCVHEWVPTTVQNGRIATR